MNRYKYFEAIAIGLIIGLLSVLPIYIIKDHSKQQITKNYEVKVEDKTSTNVNIENTFSIGCGPIQKIYKNNILIFINCSLCHNERELICGDCLGTGQGRYEARTVRVRSYIRKNGTRVRGHYRSSPGALPRCYTCTGVGKIICGICKT